MQSVGGSLVTFSGAQDIETLAGMLEFKWKARVLMQC
jgi:hypothetical protein